jgi:hypothetical protein
MRDSNLPEPELLKTVLQPLLEDFQYWFARARHLLETEQLSFLDAQEQLALLERVKEAQEQVKAAKMLFHVTQGQAGIDMAAIKPWHQLLSEYWQLAMQFRGEQANYPKQDNI